MDSTSDTLPVTHTSPIGRLISKLTSQPSSSLQILIRNSASSIEFQLCSVTPNNTESEFCRLILTNHGKDLLSSEETPLVLESVLSNLLGTLWSRISSKSETPPPRTS